MFKTDTTRHQLLAILDVLASGLIVQTALGELIYANPVARAIIGVRSNAEIAQIKSSQISEALSIYGEDDKKLEPEDMPGRQAVAMRCPTERVMSFRKSSPTSPRLIRVKSSPIFDASGEVELVVNVLQDITELRKVQQRLKGVNRRVTKMLTEAGQP